MYLKVIYVRPQYQVFPLSCPVEGAGEPQFQIRHVNWKKCNEEKCLQFTKLFSLLFACDNGLLKL